MTRDSHVTRQLFHCRTLAGIGEQVEGLGQRKPGHAVASKEASLNSPPTMRSKKRSTRLQTSSCVSF